MDLKKELEQAAKDFGEVFKVVRQRARYSQEELGKDLGLKNGQLISAIERGKAFFPKKRLPKLYELIGKSLGDIVSEEYLITQNKIQRLEIKIAFEKYGKAS